jgi:hypothetical protein
VLHDRLCITAPGQINVWDLQRRSLKIPHVDISSFQEGRRGGAGLVREADAGFGGGGAWYGLDSW